ncbi:MAG TPA: hypothetical protein VF699_08520 [Caulobacteraceae bacterium]|jgi:hypothetical protein
MRLALALPFAIAGLLSSGGAALACSCVPQRSAAEQLASADFVFKGRPLEETATGVFTAATSFRVFEVLKGPEVRLTVVRHHVDSAACGLTFRPGQTVLVFASRAPDGTWRTGSCSGAAFPEAEYRRAARGQPVPIRPPVL